MYRIHLVLALFIFPVLVNCQLIDDLEQVYYNAEYLQLNNQFEEALPLYLELISKGKNNGNIQFKAGYTYLNIPGLKHKAIPFFEKAIESASEKKKFRRETPYSETSVPVESYLYLGQAYQANNEFEKALKTYLDYKEIVKSSDKKRALVERDIFNCQYAIEMMKSLPDFDMGVFKELSMNEPSFNAAISGDGNSICFNVKRQHYTAIYFSRKINGGWSIPRNITIEVESDGTFLVSSLSHRGDILFLSHKSIDNFDLYNCNFSGISWTKATPLNNHINSMYDETHAILHKNNKSIFFVSNRKGGQGGFDMYKSVKDQKGEWGPAETLKSNLNTPYNENTPFFSRDGEKLFFSSEGHKTMGGYDILVSELNEDNSWSDPKNLGNPINTGDDDLFYVPVSTDTLGLTSRLFNKDEKHKSILLIGNFKPSISIIKKDSIHVLLAFEKSIDKSYKDIGIEISNSKGKLIETKTISPSQKELTVILPPGSYSIIAKGEEINPEPVSFTILENMKSALVSIEIKEFKAKTEPAIFNINPVYFDSEQALPEKNSSNILNNIVKAMEYYPSVLIRITGHTDSMGSVQYNKKLSYERARKVQDFLKKNNISERRIEIVGMGASNPAAKNEDRGNDNPIGRKLNRRVTFSFSGPGSDYIICKDVPFKKGN